MHVCSVLNSSSSREQPAIVSMNKLGLAMTVLSFLFVFFVSSVVPTVSGDVSMDADVDSTLRIEAGDFLIDNLVVDYLIEDVFGEDNGKDVMGVSDTGVVNDSGTGDLEDLHALDVVTFFHLEEIPPPPKPCPSSSLCLPQCTH